MKILPEEFKMPSDLYDFILNASTPHGNREHPAWQYALLDAEEGYVYGVKHALNSDAVISLIDALHGNMPVQDAMAKYHKALEEIGEG